MASELMEDDLSPVRRDYQADSDVLLILFSGLKRRPEGVPDFSFGRVIEGIPARKLFVRDLHRAWYLRGLPGVSRNVAETAAFLRREIEAQGARRVVLAGYSLGGFGALLYGALLRADVVLAFSPQTFVSLPQRLWHGDHRWQRWVLKLHCSPALFEPRDVKPLLAQDNGRTKHFIHYALDSRLDVKHALRLQGLPGVVLQEHAEGRHRLVTELRESGELRRLMEQAVQGG